MAATTRAGARVLVATLMAGEPGGALSSLAAKLHEAWGLAANFSARRKEDEAACRALGAEVHHAAIPDAIYRFDPASDAPLYPDLRLVFGVMHPQDWALTRCMAVLRELPQAQEVYVPLGVGGHVDHKLVRRAAESVFPTERIRYYEDFPYAKRRFAVSRVIWPPWRWRSEVLRLSAEALEARCRASLLYSSQLEMLSGGGERLVQRIKTYVRRVGGERIWRKV